MLLEQLKEGIAFHFADKKNQEGCPLHIEYFLTNPVGKEILEALKIMQRIGIDYLKEQEKEDILIEKGLISTK